MRKSMATLIAAISATQAMAQTPCPDNNPPIGNTNCLTNPGFEVVNQFNPVEPLGWHNISNPNFAKHRTVADGLSPALFPVGTPGALTPRSGNSCIELKARGNGGFVGFTTDTVNFFVPGFPFYDPIFDYSGGDVIVSGWYMIPGDMPLVGDAAYIKINIKSVRDDMATFENYSTTPGSGSIVGTTNGEWRLLTIVIPIEDIIEQNECNRGIRPACGCMGCVPAGMPDPNHIKITPSRYVADNTPNSGTIFFDDLTYTQLPREPDCHGACVADYDDGSGTGQPDGGVTIEDLLYYLGLFDLGATCADVDDGSGTGTPDGGVTIEDLLYYLVRFDMGC